MVFNLISGCIKIHMIQGVVIYEVKNNRTQNPIYNLYKITTYTVTMVALCLVIRHMFNFIKYSNTSTNGYTISV